MVLQVAEHTAAVETAKPEITHDHLVAGMAAVFQIGSKWNLRDKDTRALLGSPSRATFYKWKAGEVKTVPHDTVTRISLILGIYKALSILYSDPDIADDWVNRPNTAFGGDTARDRICAGEIADLIAVRDHLDAVRGGWA